MNNNQQAKELELAYREALGLANALWSQHYREKAPQWKPLPDLCGVISQIDNMAAGLSLALQSTSPSVDVLREALEKIAGYDEGMDPVGDRRFSFVGVKMIAREALSHLTQNMESSGRPLTGQPATHERSQSTLSPPDGECQAYGGLVEALRLSAETFRSYERGHAAKGTADGDAKAFRNRAAAEMCERAIARAAGEA